MDVAFDNSAASRWADTPGVLKRTISRANATGARIVIPIITASEMGNAKGPKGKAGNIERYKAIGSLRAALGRDRVAISEELTDILSAESHAAQTSVPTRGPMWLHVAREWVQDGVTKHFDAYLDKVRRWDYDKQARSDMTAYLTKQAGEVPTYKPEDAVIIVPGMLKEMLTPGFYGIEQLVDDTMAPGWVESVRKDPARYPAAIGFSALLIVHITSIMLPEISKEDWRKKGDPRFKNALDWDPDNQQGFLGDWADVWITACAAHADVLVTNDERLRQRIALVNEYYPRKLRALSLSDWLDGA